MACIVLACMVSLYSYGLQESELAKAFKKRARGTTEVCLPIHLSPHMSLPYFERENAAAGWGNSESDSPNAGAALLLICRCGYGRYSHGAPFVSPAQLGLIVVTLSHRTRDDIPRHCSCQSSHLIAIIKSFFIRSNAESTVSRFAC